MPATGEGSADAWCANAWYDVQRKVRRSDAERSEGTRRSPMSVTWERQAQQLTIRLDRDQLLETALVIAAILLGAVQAWACRFQPSTIDLVSYLDVGDAYLRGDWHAALNGYWNPFVLMGPRPLHGARATFGAIRVPHGEAGRLRHLSLLSGQLRMVSQDAGERRAAITGATGGRRPGDSRLGVDRCRIHAVHLVITPMDHLDQQYARHARRRPRVHRMGTSVSSRRARRARALSATWAGSGAELLRENTDVHRGVRHPGARGPAAIISGTAARRNCCGACLRGVDDTFHPFDFSGSGPRDRRRQRRPESRLARQPRRIHRPESSLAGRPSRQRASATPESRALEQAAHV